MTQLFELKYKQSLRLVLILACILISLATKSFAHLTKAPTANLGKRSITAEVDIATNKLGGFPTLVIDDRDIVPFVAEAGGSDIKYYYLDGSGFSPGQTLFIEVSDPSAFFTIASMYEDYGTILGITADEFGNLSEPISVKFAPTDDTPHSTTITHTSDDRAEMGTLSVDGNVAPTPVKWLSFTATATQEVITLDWATASEKSNSHFEVEVSKDPAAGFETIGRVDSKPSNSGTVTHYLFEYSLMPEAGTHYFRLKQVDIDHAFEYSKLIAIQIAATTGRAAIRVAPNPLTASSKIKVRAADAGTLKVVLVNMHGTRVFSRSYDLEGGDNSIELHLTGQLLAGLYILQSEFKGQFSYLRLIKK